MRIRGVLFLMIGLGLVLAGCGREPVQQQLIRAMAKFDAAYIPALFYADRHRPTEEAIAYPRLQNTWRSFYKKYYSLRLKYGVDITDEFWQSDLDKINGLIEDAGTMVQQKKLNQARELLEPVQPILSNLRHRHNLDYYLDRLILFQVQLGDINDMVVHKQRLSDGEKRRLIAMGDSLTKKWRGVEKAKVNWRTYGFSAKKTAAFKPLLKDVSLGVGLLTAALPAGDPAEIKMLAAALKEKYTVVYRVFGDFQPIFDELKKLKDKEQVKEAKVKEKVKVKKVEKVKKKK